MVLPNGSTFYCNGRGFFLFPASALPVSGSKGCFDSSRPKLSAQKGHPCVQKKYPRLGSRCQHLRAPRSPATASVCVLGCSVLGARKPSRPAAAKIPVRCVPDVYPVRSLFVCAAASATNAVRSCVGTLSDSWPDHDNTRSR